MLKIKPLLLAVIAAALPCFSPAWASEKVSEKAIGKPPASRPAFIGVPVLFVTDRDQDGHSFGSRRRYSSGCKHDMYYGTAMVTVPNDHKVVLDTHLAALGWQGESHKGGKIAPENCIQSTDPEAAKKEFFDRVKSALDKQNSPECCVFVHGAADAFEDCLIDAATLAYHLQKPLILYSWPSRPSIVGYFADSTNIEWSQHHFNTFCKDLLDFKAEHPLQVIALSHSMGNRLVIRALPVVYGKNLISDWELISPDIDADTCRHYTIGYSQPDARIRLYVSNKDKVLPLSQLVNGGYYRLGEAANPAVEQRHATVSEYLERIDFTAVDKGFHGHSLPFDLVADMVHNDKPGEGYALVPETSVHGNGIVRMADHADALRPTSKESDFCSRVVKVK
jgi:esterase/lipase superfamily enzyme